MSFVNLSISLSSLLLIGEIERNVRKPLKTIACFFYPFLSSSLFLFSSSLSYLLRLPYNIFSFFSLCLNIYIPFSYFFYFAVTPSHWPLLIWLAHTSCFLIGDFPLPSLFSSFFPLVLYNISK